MATTSVFVNIADDLISKDLAFETKLAEMQSTIGELLTIIFYCTAFNTTFPI